MTKHGRLRYRLTVSDFLFFFEKKKKQQQQNKKMEGRGDQSYVQQVHAKSLSYPLFFLNFFFELYNNSYLTIIK